MRKIISLILALAIGLCPIISFADELVSEVVKTEKDSFVLKLSIKSGPSIEVDGEKISFNPSAYEEGGRIYVPVRSLLEGLGYAVSYDEETETIIAINVETSSYMAMQIGNKRYSYNETAYEFDSAPHIKEDRTFVPIRIIYEMLGYDVGYDEATDTAIVTSK